jgi:hypothetical protein
MNGPLHRHVVEMDFTRIQTQLDYRLNEPWGLTLRLPYDFKERSASVQYIDDPAGQEQDMQDFLDLHHTDANLEGFSDASFLGSWHAHDCITERDLFSFSFGTSIPLGRTEDDPIAAGANAEAHEHVQFGTGTFDPLIETYYTRTVGDWSLSAFAIARLPVSENDKGYRGSRVTTLGFNALHPFDDGYAGRVALIYQREGFAHWESSGRDRNTGFTATSVKLGLTSGHPGEMRWNIGLILPIDTDPLDSSGDSFTPGPLVELSVNF